MAVQYETLNEFKAYTTRISEYISKIGGNWILVTSASHMPRAINLFQSRKLNKAIIYNP